MFVAVGCDQVGKGKNEADDLTKGKAWHQIETLIRGVGGIMKMRGDGKGGDERKKWQGG